MHAVKISKCQHGEPEAIGYVPLGFVDCYWDIGSVRNPMSLSQEHECIDIISRATLLKKVENLIRWDNWQIVLNI